MSLSGTAARALEQVKMGLYMLRGADYFTEEEWIKIDGLIHKGRYEFTNGPQQNVLEEELINFDESTNETNNFSVQITSNAFETTKAFDTIKEETVEISEQQVPSPTTSDRAESVDSPTETPNITSAEASSDDEASPPTSSDADSARVSQPTPKPEPVQRPANGGLAFYTQAQLDEVKAFNSGLTKAGKKSKPGKPSKHVEEPYNPPAPSWSQNDISEPPTYPSPTPTEQATHIQSWASGVASPAPEIVSPAPRTGWSPSPNPAPTVVAESVVEAFKDTHGRNPKSINDIIQPNNPEFRPLTTRPASRLSVKSTRKPAATPVLSDSSVLEARKLTVKPGTVLIAQRSWPKTSTIQLEIKAGDQIQVLKHVSAITHSGMNLRTGFKGHFPETVFKKEKVAKGSEALLEQQRALAAKSASEIGKVGVIGEGRHSKGMSISTVSNGLERIEGINAAEWDEVGTNSNSKMTAIAVKSPVSKPTGGLGASRFADEEKSVKYENEAQFPGLSKEEVGQLIDEKFAQILTARMNNAISTPVAPPRAPRAKPKFTEPLKKVNPKTETCFFWKNTRAGCRFTADECRDLHAIVPTPPGVEPSNQRMGKPTWAALGDSLPTATTTTTTSATEEQPVRSDGAANVGPVKSKTCWYWANDASGCNNSPEECKYLHEHCAGGVANRPTPWKRPNWSRFTTTESSRGGQDAWTVNGDAETDAGTEDSELVLEEVTAGNEWGYVNKSSASTWGADASANASLSISGWGDDKYKPPHIKALEEKALIEAAGW